MGTAAGIREWWAPRRWWSRAVSRLLPGEKKHPFDRAHSVDTGGLIYADPAAQGHAGGSHNAGYYATAPSLFHGAIALWRETLPGTGYAVEDYTLVDIGCGKGRVLLLASELEFHQIVGVELDPDLVRIARKNLRKFGRKRWSNLPGFKSEASTPRTKTRSRGPRLWGTQRVRIIEGDVLTTSLPDGPVALFYFNSFERPMMEMWLARLGEPARNRTAPLDLIYIHPEFDALVRQVSEIQVLTEAHLPFSEEDAGADVFGVTTDGCVIYRLSGFYG